MLYKGPCYKRKVKRTQDKDRPSVIELDNNITEAERLRIRAKAIGWQNDRHIPLLNTQARDELMAEVDKMPVGERIYMAKYMDLKQPERLNIFK